MDKRERLEKTIAGEPTDRIPVALWRHFPGDDQRSADLAEAIVLFQKTFDWDFVKVSPASSYATVDYGVQDKWQGNVEGTRDIVKRAIERSIDWMNLRSLDPMRGSLARFIEALNLIGNGLDDDTPFIATIFNPLAQARDIIGGETLIEHMRTRPDRLHNGLNVITESTLRLIDALKKTKAAGIYYAVQHASYTVMSEEEYRTFGLPYDRKILDATTGGNFWFNMLHLHGSAPMMPLFIDMPVQAINWHDQDTEPDLITGKAMLRGAACGGLSNEMVHLGTPNVIRETARESLTKVNGRRVILATGCVTMITTPVSNLRAVRDAVNVVSA